MPDVAHRRIVIFLFIFHHHHHHHFYYPAASMNFYFSANWVFLILRPNRMRASYFARLQLGIFTTIVVLAAYLFLFCLYSKILRLYASFKRCLFTCIVILFFAKRIIGLFHLEFSRWVLTCSPYLWARYFSFTFTYVRVFHDLTKIEVALGNTQQ